MEWILLIVVLAVLKELLGCYLGKIGQAGGASDAGSPWKDDDNWKLYNDAAEDDAKYTCPSYRHLPYNIHHDDD